MGTCHYEKKVQNFLLLQREMSILIMSWLHSQNTVKKKGNGEISYHTFPIFSTSFKPEVPYLEVFCVEALSLLKASRRMQSSRKQAAASLTLQS